MNTLERRRFACACLFAAAAPCAIAGDVLWSREWTTSGPPIPRADFSNSPTNRPLAVADNGDLVLGSPSYSGSAFLVTRMTHDGTLRWSASLPSRFGIDNGFPMVFPLADGGAYAGIGVGNEGHIARFDAAGDVVWSLDLPADRILALDASRIVVADCTHLTLVDGNAGRVVWQRGSGYMASLCQSSGLVANADGQIFSTTTRSYYEGSTLRTISSRDSYDANGRHAWHLESADRGTLLAAGSGMVYRQTAEGELLAYRQADGGVAWSFPVEPARLAVFADGEPIVSGANGTGVSRLDASTGQPRWTQPVSIGYPAVVDGALLAVEGQNLVKIDVGTGGPIWSRPAPGYDPNEAPAYTDILRTGTNELLLETSAANVQDTAFLFVRSSDGSPVGALSLPAIAQDESTLPTALANGDVLVATLGLIEPNQQLKLSRIKASDGSSAWSRSAALLPSGGYDNDSQMHIGVGAATAAIAINNSSMSPSGGGLASVVLVDAASGDVRWNVLLSGLAAAPFAQNALQVSTPQFDAAGNVFIGVASQVPCSPGAEPSCGHQTLYRLSAADGSIAWRIDRAYSRDLLEAPSFFVFGADVYLATRHASDDASSVEKRSGSSGDVLWSSTALGPAGVSGIHASPDGNMIVTGYGSAKLDASTGVTLWSAPFETGEPCSDCFGVDEAVLRDGGFLIAGLKNDVPWFWSWSAVDGSRTMWTFEPGGTGLRSSATQIRGDDEGNLWLGLVRRPVDASGLARINFLAPADLQTRDVGAQQALTFTDQTSVYGFDTLMLSTPGADGLLIAHSLQQPGAGERLVFSKLDTRITARGDLSISLDLDRPRTTQGGFVAAHAHVSYAGDAPIRGVRIELSVPWASGVREATCDGGDACVLDTRFGDARATVDLAPGASVDIRLNALALDGRGDEAVFGAVVEGPVGLAESDTLNNFARAATLQSLFANGFEAAK